MQFSQFSYIQGAFNGIFLNFNNFRSTWRILTKLILKCSQYVRIWYFNQLLLQKVFIIEVAPWRTIADLSRKSVPLTFLEVNGCGKKPSVRLNSDIFHFNPNSEETPRKESIRVRPSYPVIGEKIVFCEFPIPLCWWTKLKLKYVLPCII